MTSFWWAKDATPSCASCDICSHCSLAPLRLRAKVTSYCGSPTLRTNCAQSAPRLGLGLGLTYVLHTSPHLEPYYYYYYFTTATTTPHLATSRAILPLLLLYYYTTATTILLRTSPHLEPAVDGLAAHVGAVAVEDVRHL
eukprot:scaffold5039_cov50-Phaeocystis_antarctica.AAC.4